MKKFRSILCLLLATITTFSFVGCGSDLTPEQKEQAERVQKIKESIGTLTPMLVNDFEIPKDFYVLQAGDASGVYVGKDVAHSGKQSAKIWMHEEDAPWSGNASFTLPLKTGWRGDLSDISLVKSVSFWVYNAQDEARKVNCNMNLPGGASARFSETVPSKVWTQVVYDLKREQIPNPRCESIAFSFEGKQGYESKFYLDDIEFFKSTKGVQKQPTVLEQDEVLSFDNSSQVRNVACDGGGGGSALVATVEQSSVTANGRGSSMLITAPGGTEHYSTSHHWPTVNLYNISYTPWSTYDLNDELCFDYYSPTEGGFKELWLHIYSSGVRIVNKVVPVKRGKWTTFSMTVKDICGGREKESSFDNINQLAFCWGELNAPGQSFQIYIDNIRLKVNKR